MTAPVFLLFNKLPCELRQMIWHFALPDDNHEVLTLQNPRETVDWDDDYGATEVAPPEPMTVEMACPALMHACHESRDFVLNHSGTRFRTPSFSFSDDRFEVPFRPFRPELDTAFWSECLQWGPGEDHHCLWLSQLRHLAIPSSVAFWLELDQDLNQCLLQHDPRLQSLSVEFPVPWDEDELDFEYICDLSQKERREGQRFRHNSGRVMTLVIDARRGPKHGVKLTEFMPVLRRELNGNGKNIDELRMDFASRSWNAQSDSSVNMRCFGQTYAEWRRGEWIDAYTGNM
ncbi:hypothetical protein C8A00DRAFT_13089 [Chaetomidium leptoderma]|uniref:2EXR domain-containing protein n=1 Tax=Chaetomidium leptoderma TaxID=669021 RepID=A0AAN6ZYW4_9PEZI|nr:hypothetical protein C8A00DRAFT_13089 [Chaetomidium leptoderma]